MAFEVFVDVGGADFFNVSQSWLYTSSYSMLLGWFSLKEHMHPFVQLSSVGRSHTLLSGMNLPPPSSRICILTNAERPATPSENRRQSSWHIGRSVTSRTCTVTAFRSLSLALAMLRAYGAEFAGKLVVPQIRREWRSHADIFRTLIICDSPRLGRVRSLSRIRACE
jgi:hypothetical protein